MSDGPFACINMRKPWRNLLEKADNHNFGPDEVRRDLEDCVVGDWNIDVKPSLVTKVSRIMDGAAQSSLFGNESIQALEALRSEVAGSPFAELLLDCATQARRESHAGKEGVVEAANNACQEWITRQLRGVEEQCINKNVDRARSIDVRRRLSEAAAGATTNIVGRALGLADAGEKQEPTKQRGLDDGVPINGKR